MSRVTYPLGSEDYQGRERFILLTVMHEQIGLVRHVHSTSLKGIGACAREQRTRAVGRNSSYLGRARARGLPGGSSSEGTLRARSTVLVWDCAVMTAGASNEAISAIGMIQHDILTTTHVLAGSQEHVSGDLCPWF